MPQVSLDGLVIEVEHARPADEVRHGLERMARDLAQSRFNDWQVDVEREGEAVRLRGARDTTRFEARLTSPPGKVAVELSGGFELGYLKFKLAGGEEGVRRHVQKMVGEQLRSFLS